MLGTALVREFSEAGYAVAGLRRKPAAVEPAVRYVACDLEDCAKTRDAVARLVAEFAGIDVLICNAAHLRLDSFADLHVDEFETAWRVGVGSAIGAVQAAIPSMLARRRGTILFTGATASLRGTARFAAFASAKFALRGLAQSLAREYQPQGVHVAHVVLDGVLRGSPSEARFNREAERTLDPRETARTYRWLAEQAPSAWTHEVDLRCHTERF